MPWKVTVRAGARVRKERYDELARALEAIEAHGRQLESRGRREDLDVRVKTFEAVEQVAARIELAGPQRWFPSTTAGIDVRGDGSTEAYLGRVRRRLVEARRRESAYAALRRVVGAGR